MGCENLVGQFLVFLKGTPVYPLYEFLAKPPSVLVYGIVGGLLLGILLVVLEAFLSYLGRLIYFQRMQKFGSDTRMLMDEGFKTSNQHHTLSVQELRRVTYAISKEKSVFEEAQQNQQVFSKEVGSQILKVYQEVTHTKKSPKRRKFFSPLFTFVWRFQEIAEATDILAGIAEKRWDKLDLQYREAYKDLVYTFILGENSDGNDGFSRKTSTFKGFFSTIHVYLILLLVILKYGSSSVYEFFNSVKRLKNFVLNVVEEENVDYQKDLKDILGESNMVTLANKTTVTQEEFRDWLDTPWD